jgi:hypothetical protein
MTERLPQVGIKWIFAIVGICLLNATLGAAVYAGAIAFFEEPEPTVAIVEEDFVYVERGYDINPRQTLVLYTNYACPFCAELYETISEVEVTTRIFLIENQSERFSTQEIVSPYMLKLSRIDYKEFFKIQGVLYACQNEWVVLGENDVLIWLNEQSGQNWTKEDLTGELKELRVLEGEAPSSLLHVPTLYFNDSKIL